MTTRYTDYHCHLLPGIDDGSSSLEQSLEMAKILVDCGFGTVHCTPHWIKGCFDNEPEKVRLATRQLQRHVHEAGIDLKLVPGTEHYMDEFLLDQAGDAITTGTLPHLLVEVPFASGKEILAPVISWMLNREIVPLLAHPERCNVFEPGYQDAGLMSLFLRRQKRPDMESSLILNLKDAGCRFQGNLGSFAGYYGPEIKRRALLFLQHGVYSCLGSDAHKSERLGHIISHGIDAIVSVVGEAAAVRLLTGQDLNPLGA
ncbi:tyrosine protein phosphatase [Geomonas sp. Red276]